MTVSVATAPKAQSMFDLGDYESDPLYEQIQKLEKCELHTHLTGGIDALDLFAIAKTQRKMPAFSRFIEERRILAQRANYAECFRFFSPIEEILGVNKPTETPEELKRVRSNIIACVMSVCRQYAEDNVKYVELRTSLKKIAKDGDFKPYLDAVLDGIQQAEKKYAMKVNLLLSVRRSTTEEACQETVDLAIKHMYPKTKLPGEDYSRHKVVGMDLSGSSIEGNGEAALACLKRARAAGLPIAVHIGESKDETAERQKLEMEELQPQSTGHAVNMHDRENLGNTLNEYCPSSAYFTKMHDEEDGHPSLEDLRTGRRPTVIGCDDLAMFREFKLSLEIYRVAKHLGWGITEVENNQALAKGRRFKNYIKRGLEHIARQVLPPSN